ncbi:DUF3467 domain-containing protein [Devosia chinhatensis]|uniref:DUF3467 domain-containing protein n=1 Tax=Devosia chinhatensis TaxID=429727 RepID=A0A0F5FK88_9HYPH|nr:DUF3467 domain-containing protein [Devosia chinhatensis]KKB08617.1 hypothetical protein VE26_00515 [Devosia chinhatensis]
MTTIEGLSATTTDENRQPVSITWNDKDIVSQYSNIATVTATREEFFFLFGTHQNWRGVEGGQPVEVELSNRMVLSPFAAKRLLMILNQTVKAYEQRFGEVKL